MGCAASKLDHEDTVRRCKERRRLMAEAVSARHHLAAAHADYCRSLRAAGSALSVFAADEPLAVFDFTPAVLLPKDPSAPPAAVPPPAPSSSPTITSSKLPHILSTSSLNSSGRRNPSSQPKLPHVLSDSSPSTPATAKSAGKFDYPATYMAHAAYASTPSQPSSVWNWENFQPPSPPGSDFFNRHRNEKNRHQIHHLEAGG